MVKGNGLVHAQVIEFPRHWLDKVFKKLDAWCWRLGFRNDFKKLFSLSEQLNGTYHKLQSSAAYQEADIIHLHNLHGNYFDLGALEKIAREKIVVWTLHDMWAVTGGEFYTYNNLNYQKGIGKTPVDYLYPLRRPFVDCRQRDMNWKRKIYARIAGRLTMVPVSEWLHHVVKSAYVFHPNLQVQTIFNGVDTTVFYNKSLRTWNTPRVLFFNASGESKASPLFTNIIKKITWPFQLYLVGNPIDHPAVCYHTPFISNRSELNCLYNKVDILVFPSKAETFGLVPLEAMACGVCVIASDSTALPEVVKPELGYIFTSGEEEHLLFRVNSSLHQLEESRRRGALAAQWAIHSFSLDKCHKAYFALYQQLLAAKSKV
ncbi:glycosyl transferase, group 1 family protein [Filimonas lacunae]|nr:glycosyl transferase, group 1 family protein [Filimonas lacunae]